MRSAAVLGLAAGITVTMAFAGCSKKNGKAVVLEKEHIAAREASSTPNTERAHSSIVPAAGFNESAANEEEKPRELGKDEIVVDSYIMNKDVRGSSRDPRAMSDEQWVVKVQMINNLRQFDVRTDKLHWDKVKIGDQVTVSYRQGKYTGTVWAAELD